MSHRSITVSLGAAVFEGVVAPGATFEIDDKWAYAPTEMGLPVRLVEPATEAFAAAAEPADSTKKKPRKSKASAEASAETAAESTSEPAEPTTGETAGTGE